MENTKMARRRDTVECPIPSVPTLSNNDYVVRHEAYLLRRESLTKTWPCLPSIDALELSQSEEQS